MSQELFLERSIQLTLAAVAVLFYAAAAFPPVDDMLMNAFRLLFGGGSLGS